MVYKFFNKNSALLTDISVSGRGIVHNNNNNNNNNNYFNGQIFHNFYRKLAELLPKIWQFFYLGRFATGLGRFATS